MRCDCAVKPQDSDAYSRAGTVPAVTILHKLAAAAFVADAVDRAARVDVDKVNLPSQAQPFL